MIIATRTFIRTDETVPWHLDHPFAFTIYTQEFKDHTDREYRAKKIDHTYALSDDKLTLTFIAYWQTMEGYQEYMNDPICLAMFERRDAHNKYYGTISEPSVITEA